MSYVEVGRRAYFSCGHSYKKPGISESESKKLWGELYVPGGWGRNFTLEARLHVDPPGSDGVSFSLEDLDRALGKVAHQLDHTYLNTDVAYFATRVPTLENIAGYIFEELKKEIGKSLHQVRLFEDESTWVDCDGSKLYRLTQCFKISALHRHHNPDLSMEENIKLYTKCATLHGHQYLCEVTFAGELVSDAEILVQREQFRQRVHRTIVEPFHGSVLNDLIGNTSGELLYLKLEQLLKREFGPNYGGLLVRETRKNSFQGVTA
jgi:6-pyruvoyltetrahydropterin/6-carboxytetrahydropterin synthase